ESEVIEFKKRSRKEAYQWIEETLKRFDYLYLGKKEKGLIKKYLQKVTGYSRPQVTRQIRQYRETGRVRLKEYKRNKFERKYTNKDILLLAQTAELHDYPNGAALKRTLERMAKEYGEEEYRNIANISVSHIYNLRKTVSYQRSVSFYQGTKKSKGRVIGERCKPEPAGKPGYLRVDTMHQGDRDGQKGVYHVNTVDEIVQWEVAGAAEKITEEHLIPLLGKIISSYPYRIINFHADNGSEYVNSKVAEMLNNLLVKLTKSRPRHSNDNALAETKNGWVLRKWLGYGHIGQKHAKGINDFYFGCFNEYLNFHRPCAFPIEVKDKKGKIKKKYRYQDYMTPYEKLRSIPDAQIYLKESVTLERLDKIARRYTDNEMAKKVQLERDKLFDKILAA
ncbi:MAG: integrase, partial [Candidatus Altiarchaeales archaeon HGW-Altiarchaeales-1]